MNWLEHAVSEYWPPGIVMAILAIIARHLRPRRLLTFLTAVMEREDMLAAAQYWEAEAARREKQLTACRAERDRMDQEIARLREARSA